MFSRLLDPFVSLHQALDTCAELPLGTADEPALHEAMKAWVAASSRLSAVGAQLMARWDRSMAWADDGCANATQWLNAWGEVDQGRRHLRVARNLDRHAPLTAAALAAGELSYAKASIMAAAIEPDLAESYALSEEVLVATAQQVTVPQVATLVRRWKQVAEAERHTEGDPDEGRRDQRYLSLSDTLDGMVRIDGLLDPEIGAALRAAIAELERRHHRQDVDDARIEAEAAARNAGDPVDDAATTAEDRPAGRVCGRGLRRTARQRRADALADLLDRYRATAGHDGGPRTHLNVTASLPDLLAAAGRTSGLDPDLLQLPDPITRLLARDRVGARTDAQGHPYPDAALARDACDCLLTRMLLDEHGVPLALGRTQRLVSAGQRRALVERDRGCAFPGCDRGPEWCDAHHIVHWLHGGATDLDNLVLLCRTHHTRMHEVRPWGCAMDDERRRPSFTRPDGTPLPRPRLRIRWLPDLPLPRPPDQGPARVTAA
jgi:hypothetical protein